MCHSDYLLIKTSQCLDNLARIQFDTYNLREIWRQPGNPDIIAPTQYRKFEAQPTCHKYNYLQHSNLTKNTT